MTPAERKALERERLRALGLLRRELWVHPTRLDEYVKLKDKLRTEKHEAHGNQKKNR